MKSLELVNLIIESTGHTDIRIAARSRQMMSDLKSTVDRVRKHADEPER